MRFENTIAGFIEAEGLFSSAQKVLLALSGGADSCSLIYSVCALKKRGLVDTDFICAHINHQLRGHDADTDEDFVKAQCEKLDLPLSVRRVDVAGFAKDNKLSIETAARQLRMDLLLDIAKANDCKTIATAHHKDDNAETMVQRLARGTGFRGTCGIWPAKEFGEGIRFVRPMLCVTRDEIIEYLQGRQLKWCTDRTNEDLKYRRNYIRHRLIPDLQEQYENDIAEDLFELSCVSRRFYRFIHSQAEKIWQDSAQCSEDKVELNLAAFLQQPPEVKAELVRLALTKLGCGQRDLTMQHFEKIFKLAEQGISGKQIELPGGFIALREYEKLIFYKITAKAKKNLSESIELSIPGQSQFGDYLVEATVSEAGGGVDEFKRNKTGSAECFDLDKLKLPLVVRFRKDGDRFVPFGQCKAKKIGKFLTAQRVPAKVREGVVIVAAREKIIWVWPIRMSEEVKVTEATKKILRLQITNQDS